MRIDNRTLVLGMLAAGVMTTAAMIRAQDSTVPKRFTTEPPATAPQPSSTIPANSATVEGYRGSVNVIGEATTFAPGFPPSIPQPAMALPRLQSVPGVARYTVQDDAVRAALKSIQESDSDEVREEAESQLRKALREQFEADIKHRQQELEAIAARLKEMRSKLDKRMESAEQIIDLRMQVLLQDAEGLGWTSGVVSGYDIDGFSIPPAVIGSPYPPPAPNIPESGFRVERFQRNVGRASAPSDPLRVESTEEDPYSVPLRKKD